MRNQVKVLLTTVALVPLVVWGPRIPAALSEMETFRVSEVTAVGVRYLTEDTVVARLELGPFASVWSAHDVWIERLEAHPLVRTAEIQRRLPNGLRVTVTEREPVALAATPVLEPVDAEGHRLPIDPTLHALDLPVIASERAPPAGATLFPREVRLLAAEIEAFRRVDEEFVRRVSTVRRREDGVLSVRLVSPDVDLVMPLGTRAPRLREAEAALTDAISRDPSRMPTVVDLRFESQVVVRRTRKE